MLGLPGRAQEIDRAHVVGSSMGGRIGIEMGLSAPDRISGLGLLCPAVAWVKRGFHPLVRLLRPEFGLLPHGFSRRAVASQFWSMFHDRDAIDPEVGDLMVDEFRRIYHPPAPATPFWLSARNIYLEAPRSRRLLSAPSPNCARRRCSSGAANDRLVPAAFSRHVGRVAARRRAGHPRRMRARAAGRAGGGVQRLLEQFFARVERAVPRKLASAASGKPPEAAAVRRAGIRCER